MVIYIRDILIVLNHLGVYKSRTKYNI